LVVIAIIGILAGMVVVNMSGATDSAKIAKSKVFSSSVKSSLLMNRFSEWKLDEGSGATTADTIGPNNGILSGGPLWKSGADCVSDGCLQFDGVDDYVDCGDISTVNWSGLTAEAWVYRTANGMNGYAGVYYKGTDSDLGRFLITDSGQVLVQNGNGNFYSTGLSDVPKNVWTHVLYAHDRSAGQEYIYINGKIRGQQARTGDIAQNTTNLWIGFGYSLANNYMFPGFIDEVRIYNSALPASAIRSHYIAGLEKLLAGKQITTQYYQQKAAELNLTYAENK
jgi:type II secretory pathway pseudopilin PulG